MHKSPIVIAIGQQLNYFWATLDATLIVSWKLVYNEMSVKTELKCATKGMASECGVCTIPNTQ